MPGTFSGAAPSALFGAASGRYQDADINIPINANGSAVYDTAGKSRLAALQDPNSQSTLHYQPADAAARQAQYSAQQAGYNARQAPTADYAQADFAQALGMGARGSQADALGMYRDAANGVGTSVAQAQFAQALQQQQREQASMAASTRGGGLQRAAAQRMAMNNSADMGANSAAASAALRAQEIAAARGGLAGLATGMRGQDLGLQGQNAQQAQFQAQQQAQARAQNDAMSSFYESQKTGLSGQQFQGQMALEQAKEGAITLDQGQQAINQGGTNAADARTDKYMAGALGATASALPYVAAAVSDERSKTDIRSATSKIDAFLEALKAADYAYKDPGAPGAGPGRHTSVMAQDLEKSELGRRMVDDGPAGKTVDYKEGFATLLAAQAALKSELTDLKKALNAKHGARKAAA